MTKRLSFQHCTLVAITFMQIKSSLTISQQQFHLTAFFILAEGMVFVGSSNLQNSQLFFMRRTQIYALIMRHLSVALMAQESISAPSSNRMRVVSIS
nr:MAG TPA: hypothetical protein [Bacteriophage sp.]